MKGSLIIVAFFVAGVILARWGVLPQELLQQDFSMYVLYGLMFLVGISIGSDRKAWAGVERSAATDCTGAFGDDCRHVGRKYRG